MKVGDLVKWRKEDLEDPDSGKGLLIEIRMAGPAGEYGVMWDFLKGKVGWQREWEIEVINESNSN